MTPPLPPLPPLPTLATPALLQSLESWAERAWLRRLDRAFAGFLVDLCPGVAPPVVLAAALLAHLEGRGHSCLAIDELLHDADALLGWPGPALAEWRAVLAALPPHSDDWLAALQASPLVAVQGAGTPPRIFTNPATNAAPAPADAATPLVLSGRRLYLRRYWAHERQVAAQVLRRSRQADAVPIGTARAWLDRLFPADASDRASHAASAGSETAAAPAAIDWQKVACAVALRGRLTVITGGPGTGKTYTAARLLALLLALDAAPQRLRVALAAPTGKAAARLKQSIDAALAGLQQRLGDGLPLLELASHTGPARTLHSLLGARPDTRQFRFDAAHPLPLDVLIVDEASMVHLEMMAALLAALPAAARLVLLGDKDQLASVEAGAVLGDLCRSAEAGHYQPATAAYILAATGQAVPAALVSGGRAGALSLAQQTVMLRQSRRYGGPIGALALAVNAGQAQRAQALLAAPPGGPLGWLDAPSPAALLRLALHGRAGAEGGYRHYLDALQSRTVHLERADDTDDTDSADSPESAASAASADAAGHAAWVRSVLAAFDRFRLLCAVRDGDWGSLALNIAVERALVEQGGLVKRGAWYEGRPVMVTRNNPGAGVFNGDIGIVLRAAAAGGPGAARAAAADPALRVWFADGAALRSVAISRLSDVETAFAMTVHKAQGSEFLHTVLVLPAEPSRALSRELVYTGITRARDAFTLVSGRRQVFADALAQRTRRASGLLGQLDELDQLDQLDRLDEMDRSEQADVVTGAASGPGGPGAVGA